MKKSLFLIILICFLSGCAVPLPKEKLDYVGDWQSKEMRLLILADGTVAYKRLKGGGTTSINGPLKKFVGNDFVVGVLFMTTKFEVSIPPTEEGGHWVMTVDGVKLKRIDE